MTKAGFAGARTGTACCGFLLLAMSAAGCTGEEYGSVPAAPKASPDVVAVPSAGKDAPVPRVPRGPNQAKALQEAAKK